MISIIIPVYNGAATIGETLHAAAAQDYPGTIEIIVVDDGSLDGTVRVVEKFSGVRYVCQRNAGPAAARNHGARLAQGEVLIFTDADCTPHRDWVRKLMERLSAPPEDGCVPSPSVGAAAVKGSYGISNPQSRLARGVHGEIVYRHRHFVPDKPLVFGSYNVAIRRDVFEQLGGFDENYPRASGEDNDLSYRLRGAGFGIVFARDALVDHRHPESAWRYWREQCRHGFWRAKMYRDHPAMGQGDGYTFWKDRIEVPLSGLVVLSLPQFALAFAGAPAQAGPFLLFAVILLSLQIFFAFRMIPGRGDALWFSGVTFVRAFARTAGFACGFLRQALVRFAS